MALAGRSARRGGAGFRWIAAGVAITLLVLLINASLNSSSPGPARELAVGAWVDRVLPVIGSSTAEGQEIQNLWAGGLRQSPAVVASTVSQVAAGAAANYQTVAKLRPPADLGGTSGLLEAALLARSQAAANLKTAIDATLGAAVNAPPVTAPPPPPSTAAPSTLTTPTTSTAAGSSATSSTTTATSTTTTTVPAASPPAGATAPTPQVAAIASAGNEIQVGDQAYALFMTTFPASAKVKMPASVWAPDTTPYQQQPASVFLTSLSSVAVTTPLHQVKVYAIATNPAPVSIAANGMQTLPDAPSITVTVVVADTGNQPESNLTVTAAIAPAGRSASVRDFVNLTVGQAYTVSALGPLSPPQGVPVTLTVTVSGTAASGVPPAQASIAIEEPAPAAPPTT